MAASRTLTTADPAAERDPSALLDRAWALEPALRIDERRAVLDRLEQIVEANELPAAPVGRDWRLALWAERAIDAAAADRLDEALELAGRVLASADEVDPVATARATLARGRALAWQGTEESTRSAEGVLVEATERFAALGKTEWAGFSLFWRGHSICYENGRLLEAERLIADALTILPYSSPRRATILDFYADVLADLGEWDRAEAVLDEAYGLAETADNAKARAYVTWTRARVAAGHGDTVRSERLFNEVERDATDWWQNYGAYFLCDAARTLDMLGLRDQAYGYLERARDLVERSGAGSGATPDAFEPLALARALMLARSGDPAEALTALQGLARQRWLEKRLLWRFTLLGAWARLRAGDREQAGIEARRAFEQAVDIGGVHVAVAGEPEISALLAPLAIEAGSAAARCLLTADAELVVRLFGTPRVEDREGNVVSLPAGKPGELVRMLALHPHGLSVEVVLEAFFPEAAPSTSRPRLRQVLTRLRAAAGEIVIRDGEVLRLVPAWVDAREFPVLARRSRAARGTRALVLGQGALALAERGPLLVADPYADWAEAVRTEIEDALEQLRQAA